MAEKYVVFKAEDFYFPAIMDGPKPLNDVFVLRSSDMLASQTLHSYAGLALTVLEMDTLRHFLTAAERTNLELCADAASQLGVEWQRDAFRGVPS